MALLDCNHGGLVTVWVGERRTQAIAEIFSLSLGKPVSLFVGADTIICEEGDLAYAGFLISVQEAT